MSTAERTRPFDWAIDRFGEYIARELRQRVPMALAAAVNRAMDAHEASQMSTDHAFGNARWPLQYEELVNHLQSLPGTTPIRPPHAFYQLVVVRGHVLLPWHYAKVGVDMRSVRPSRSFGLLARALLTEFGPEPHWEQLPLLPLPRDEADERETAEISEALAAMSPRPKTLIVGYACNSQRGLLRVGWGDAALTRDGRFDWHHYDEMAIPPGRVPAPRNRG